MTPSRPSINKGRVLIVDEEPNAVKVLSAILGEQGYAVSSTDDIDTAIGMIAAGSVDTVITEYRVREGSGMDLFDHVKKNHPEIPVIFLTAYGTVDSAVQLMTGGVFYYFIKPPDYAKLSSMLARAVEQRRLKMELDFFKKRFSEYDGSSFVIGSTPDMKNAVEVADAIKDSSSSVLVCGETGTGKELIAKRLHYYSVRRDMPFVALNCAAIPRDLLEAELFGYEKGAFTGAVSRRVGRFEAAQGGTVFLDEIGELEYHLQAKLLRVLQERELERLGSNRKIKVDFRLVSSDNQDLRAKVEAGKFRRDLFYRINVVQINLPPLRDRKEDIPMLVDEFVKEFCLKENKTLAVSDEIRSILTGYPWPGNIRQLRNVVERMVMLAKGGVITPRELPSEFHTLILPVSGVVPVKRTLKDIEAEAVKQTLIECRGNKSKAARMLGISRKALYKRLSEERFLGGLYPLDA